MARKPAPEVKFTNVDKVYFPKAKFTKGEMIRYYIDVAPYILPHLKDRPVTLIRFPNGVDGEKFYEKNAPKFAPSWLKTHLVARRHVAGSTNYILINDAASLAWCANLGAIELHPFLHRVQKLEVPTHVVFDLDPGEGMDLRACAKVAFLIKEITDALDLEMFAKVSGSKGLQLYIPLNTPTTYAATGAFAKTIAKRLAQEHPELVVSEMSKELRRGHVMIDWSQNNGAKTTVAVYSMRAKRDTPYISMPVTWEELKRMKKPEALSFTPAAALKRLKKLGDLFAPLLTLKQKLPKSLPESADAGPAKSTTRAAAKKKAAKKAEGTPTLKAYKAKRDFTKTKEPGPVISKSSSKGGGRFVIQKHAASHLHYDFRLEMNGTLKSWAVPKGVPTELGVKRSAFQVEDHPVGYLEFEGTIPKGQYGGGTVMVWDIGTYDLIGGSYAEHNLKFVLHGKKLKGEWHIFKIKSNYGKDVWLIAKYGDAAKPITAKQENASAISGRSMEKIAADNDRVWK